MYLNSIWPQAAFYRPIHPKGHLSFGDTCPLETPVLWGHLSFGDTCPLGTPVLWGHLSFGDTCPLGTPVLWGHLSFGDTCPLGTPVLWGHLSFGDTCPLGTPVLWGHLSFGDTYLDSYSCLPVLCVLYLAACLAFVCTMQCRTASKTHYTVLGSFQRILNSFLCSIYCIFTTLWSYLS